MSARPDRRRIWQQAHDADKDAEKDADDEDEDDADDDKKKVPWSNNKDAPVFRLIGITCPTQDSFGLADFVLSKTVYNSASNRSREGNRARQAAHISTLAHAM